MEDDDLVRDTVALMLAEDGFEVTEAADADEALRLVRDGLQARVIVTDVDLGGGPSGADLADALHELHPELPVIFITGRSASLAGRARDAREAVLLKPFESHDLADLVNRMRAAVKRPDTTTR